MSLCLALGGSTAQLSSDGLHPPPPPPCDFYVVKAGQFWSFNEHPAVHRKRPSKSDSSCKSDMQSSSSSILLGPGAGLPLTIHMPVSGHRAGPLSCREIYKRSLNIHSGAAARKLPPLWGNVKSQITGWFSQISLLTQVTVFNWLDKEQGKKPKLELFPSSTAT